MGFRTSLHYTGIALQFFGIGALVPLLVALAYEFKFDTWPPNPPL